MKRILILLALIVGIASAGYYGYQRTKSPAPVAVGPFVHVPADTLYFFGAQSDDHSGWLRFASAAPAPTAAELAEVQDLLADAGPAGSLLYGLYSIYAELLADSADIAARTGIRADGGGLFYGLGLVPVLHQPLADPAAFRALLDDAERRGQISHQPGEFRGVALRRYSVGDSESDVQLVVAVSDEKAILTLDTPLEREQVLAQALGLELPALSLAETGLPNSLIKQYDFAPVALGYINHRAAVAGLTGSDDGLLARMLTTLAAEAGEDGLAPLRTPACRAELAALVEHWPLTAFGYRDVDLEAGRFSMEAIFAAGAEPQMTDLLRLQGHIPAALRQREAVPIAAAALGLDVDALAPVVQALWQQAVSADLQCEFLLAAQQQLRQHNPVLLSLGTAMLSGIRGVGAALYQPAERSGAADPDSLRVMLTLSATDPAALLTRIQALTPQLGGLVIPANGSAVALPPLFGNALPPLQAAIRGQHLVIYTDAPASVLQALAEEPLSGNGLWWMRLDYSRLLPLLQPVLSKADQLGASPEQAAEMREQLQQLGDIDAAVELRLELRPQGVVLGTEVELLGEPN